MQIGRDTIIQLWHGVILSSISSSVCVNITDPEDIHGLLWAALVVTWEEYPVSLSPLGLLSQGPWGMLFWIKRNLYLHTEEGYKAKMSVYVIPDAVNRIQKIDKWSKLYVVSFWVWTHYTFSLSWGLSPCVGFHIPACLRALWPCSIYGSLPHPSPRWVSTLHIKDKTALDTDWSLKCCLLVYPVEHHNDEHFLISPNPIMLCLPSSL